VRTFCSTQQLARRLAQEFNEKMDTRRRIHPNTPRVSFLDCSIYEIKDKNLGKLSVLVEKKLDHTRWHKWNSNNGFVEGMAKAPARKNEEKKQQDVKSMKDSLKFVALDLGAIVEGSEEEEESSDEEEGAISTRAVQPILFSASEVAQCFSHFTYQATGRKRLVCDLQGIFDEDAIHYHNPKRSDRRYVQDARIAAKRV